MFCPACGKEAKKAFKVKGKPIYGIVCEKHGAIEVMFTEVK
jgi:hypothetical protein